jgi:beta-lactam-binding protein with PASTA domain
MMIKVFKTGLFILIFMVTAALSAYFSVHLLIRSEKTVITPDVEGKEVVSALELLSDLKLNTKVKGSQFDAAIPRHHVISQDPEPGTEIKQGRDIRLIISKGPRNVIFPNLKGTSLAQARILLEENGLQLRQVSHMYQDRHPRQEVLGQFPAAAHQGSRGDGVDLLVSEGPAPLWYRMLALKGMPLNGAVAAIEQNHLLLKSVHYLEDAAAIDRTVIEQDPPQGYPLLATTDIELGIAWRSGALISDGKRDASLYRYRVAQGFLRESIRVRINWGDTTLDVFNNYVPPGYEIWLLVPNRPPATLFLYADDQLLKTDRFE